MLRTILGIFGHSPFTSLQSHMTIVEQCVDKLPSLFYALKEKNYEKVEEIADKISELEHQADLIKNHIRNHLSKNIYLPIERQHLLDILSIQDDMADSCQDAGVLSTLKNLSMIPLFEIEFDQFLQKNIESFKGAKKIIMELHELIETSFGGVEAEKVRAMIDDVATKEHEVDLIQRNLLKKFFLSEDQMTYTTFYLWQKIFASVANLSNLSEKLANRLRLTLELK